MPISPHRLLIIGASIRPWVASAVASAYEVCGFDFFADWDTRTDLLIGSCHPANKVLPPVVVTSELENRRFKTERGSITRIQDFDQVFSFPDWADCAAAIVCGGFENRPELLDRLSESIRILGTAPENLGRLLNPVEVFERARQSGLLVPLTKYRLQNTDRPADWLRKDFRSSGGSGVHSLSEIDRSAEHSQTCFQHRIAGANVSAVFVSTAYQSSVATPNRRPDQIQTQLLGMTEQWVGRPDLGAARFQYCGSIGPINLPPKRVDEIVRLGRWLANTYSIQGMWGGDFIWNDSGSWAIDLNPRLTASMELFESAIKAAPANASSVIDLHVKSCRGLLTRSDFAALDHQTLSRHYRHEGKCILYHSGKRILAIAEQHFAELQALIQSDFFQAQQPGVTLADIPDVGSTISPGNPILSIRVRSSNRNEVIRALNQNISFVRRLLATD